MNKVVTGSLWASTLLLGALAGCGSGSSSGDSTTVTVAGDVPIAYAQRANTMSLNPHQRRPERAGWRPDDPREVLARVRSSTT